MAVYIVKTKITSKLIISAKITKFVKDKRGEWERRRGLATGHDFTKKHLPKVAKSNKGNIFYNC